MLKLRSNKCSWRLTQHFHPEQTERQDVAVEASHAQLCLSSMANCWCPQHARPVGIKTDTSIPKWIEWHVLRIFNHPSKCWGHTPHNDVSKLIFNFQGTLYLTGPLNSSDKTFTLFSHWGQKHSSWKENYDTHKLFEGTFLISFIKKLKWCFRRATGLHMEHREKTDGCSG